MIVAFPSFKVSKFSGGGFSQTPYTLAALVLASDRSPSPPPPPFKIRSDVPALRAFATSQNGKKQYKKL